MFYLPGSYYSCQSPCYQMSTPVDLRTLMNHVIFCVLVTNDADDLGVSGKHFLR